MLKRYLIMLAALTAAHLAAFTSDFSKCRISEDEKQKSYWIFDDTKGNLVGGIGIQPGEDMKKVKISIVNGKLVVDARPLYEGKTLANRNITIRFYGIDTAKAAKAKENFDKNLGSKTNDMIYRVKGEPEGTEAHIYFEGAYKDQAGKPAHFWQVEKFCFNGLDFQDAKITRTIPETIENLWARFDIRTPGLFTFEKIDFNTVDVQKKHFDPNRNYIMNGGAELGFSDTSYAALKLKKNALTGSYVDFRGCVISDDDKISIDSTTFHSGKRSFKIEAPVEKCNDDFRFNMVPAEPGKPLTLSFWAKANENTPIDMTFFVCSGTAVVQTFSLTTEWQRYEMHCPSWGYDHGSCAVIGSPIGSAGAITGYVQPTLFLRFRKVTVWLDDVAYSIGGKAEFKDEHKLWIRSKLDNPKTYYFAGTPVKAALELENPQKTPISGELSYELKTIQGKVVYTSPVLKKLNFAPNGTLKENVTIVPPAHFRGPFVASFLVKFADGSKEVKNEYFGIINPRPAKLCSRTAIEVPAGQNINIVIPYLLDFGFKGVRIGAASADQKRSFELVEPLWKAGFEILFTASLNVEEQKDPAKWKAYFDFLAPMVKKYKGKVAVYETQNEANIANWTIEENLRMIEDLKKVVSENDPSAKIGGPTPCSIDFTWIDNVLRRGGAKNLDIITAHPYRSCPELPDAANDAVAVKRVSDLYKKDMPYWGTEAGYVHMAQIPNWEFNDWNINTTGSDLRNMIQGCAGGMTRYHQFAFESWGTGSAWHCTYLGNPDNEFLPRPAPLLYAYRNFTDRIGDSPYAKKVKLGMNFRCHIFNRTDDDTRVAVLWKWNGKPTTLNFSADVAKQMTAFDFGGTKVDSSKLELGVLPVYLESKMSADALEKAITGGNLGSSDGHSVELDSTITGDNAFDLIVRNITGKPVSVNVTVSNKDVVVGSLQREVKNIAPEATAHVAFQTKKPVSTKDGMVSFQVENLDSKEKANIDVNVRGIIAHKTPKAITIDGDLSDWPASATVIRLDKNNASGKSARWNAKADQVTADLRYTWDDNYLYISAVVDKPDYHTLKDITQAMSSWMYDGLQICFDPMRNGNPKNVQFDDDDFEYALNEISGKPTVFRRWASSAAYDSLPKLQGIITEVKFAIGLKDGKRIYEAAFPRRAVSPFKLRAGNIMRTSLIVNMNDGVERIGYLELTKGIGDSKTPGLWMDIVLLP